MHEWIVFGLPIVWALVAVAVALLLYRSSSGVLRGERLFGLPINSIRLGGSVVIFFVAFLLLHHATPSDRPDKMLVDRAQVQRMEERTRRLDNLVLQTRGCLLTDTGGEACMSKFSEIKGEVETLRREFDALRPPAAVPAG